MNAAPSTDADDARSRLLAAGRRLSDRLRRSELTAQVVCAEAGLPLERFDSIYPSINTYHCELLGLLIDDIRDAVTRITTNMGSGIPRLKLSLETYLEANASRPTLRELLMALRFDPDGIELIRKRVSGFRVMMELELRSARWPRPEITARLLTAAVTDIAQAEQEAGGRVPGLRETLFRYLDSRSA